LLVGSVGLEVPGEIFRASRRDMQALLLWVAVRQVVKQDVRGCGRWADLNLLRVR
jgi:hypothetical protein